MEPGQIPPKTTGLTRIIKAFFYSLDGLGSVYRTEAAFRQELWALLPATVLVWFLPLEIFWQLWLSFGALFLLLVELVNTGIERLVDLASPGFHPLAKDAKDIGSALVLLSLLFYLALWGLCLWQSQDRLF